jgi:hypothetical protein
MHSNGVGITGMAGTGALDGLQSPADSLLLALLLLIKLAGGSSPSCSVVVHAQSTRIDDLACR